MSNKRVLLISEKQVKDQTIVESNVDAKVLSKAILNVQELELKNVLGSTLYNQIIDAVYASVNSSTPMTADQQTLLDDYIQPFLIHAAVVDLIIFGQFRITNKGVVKLTDDAAETVSGDELEAVRKYHDNYKQEYKKNLIEFLKTDKLVQPDSNTDGLNTSTGWFLEPDFPYYQYPSNGNYWDLIRRTNRF